MFQPYSFFVGLRYTRSKQKSQFVSFISLISILGIAIGVWALITITSVMNGFESELRDRILGMASHATVQKQTQRFSDWQNVIDQVTKEPKVIGAAPYVEGQVMLNSNGKMSGSIIRGIEPSLESEVSQVSDKMLIGDIKDLQPGQWNIILGAELLQSLRLRIGDRVTVIAPQTNITAAGFIPRTKTFTVAGAFRLGMHEYDSALAFMNTQDAAKLFKLPKGTVTGVRLKLDDMFDAPKVSRTLNERLGYDYNVKDWTQRHVNLFKAIKTERRVMFIILLLIVAVAAFNIISTLIMVVTDKRADIAILRTLGASPKSIMGIFIVQGTLVGIVGTLLGMFFGVLSGLYIGDVIAFIEELFNFKVLDSGVYYISDLPSELRWPNVFLAGLFSFLISVLVTLYPSWRAAKIKPAEALRYE